MASRFSVFDPDKKTSMQSLSTLEAALIRIPGKGV